jgi:aldehyde dehydrogenase (NAD+)
MQSATEAFKTFRLMPAPGEIASVWRKLRENKRALGKLVSYEMEIIRRIW